MALIITLYVTKKIRINHPSRQTTAVAWTLSIPTKVTRIWLLSNKLQRKSVSVAPRQIRKLQMIQWNRLVLRCWGRMIWASLVSNNLEALTYQTSPSLHSHFHRIILRIACGTASTTQWASSEDCASFARRCTPTRRKAHCKATLKSKISSEKHRAQETSVFQYVYHVSNAIPFPSSSFYIAPQLTEQLSSDNDKLRRQALILSYLPDPVVMISIDGKIKFCNMQLARVLRHKITRGSRRDQYWRSYRARIEGSSTSLSPRIDGSRAICSWRRRRHW